MSGRKRIDILSPALLAGLVATAVRPDGLGFLIGFAAAAVALVTLVAVSRRPAPAGPGPSAAKVDSIEEEVAKMIREQERADARAHRGSDSAEEPPEPPLQKKGKQ